MLFSVQMNDLGSPGRALSSNLLGAMADGFLEYNSLYIGFRSLYFFALVLYVCAYLSTVMRKPPIRQIAD
jgi:hypothetical protein